MFAYPTAQQFFGAGQGKLSLSHVYEETGAQNHLNVYQ